MSGSQGTISCVHNRFTVDILKGWANGLGARTLFAYDQCGKMTAYCHKITCITDACDGLGLVENRRLCFKHK